MAVTFDDLPGSPEAAKRILSVLEAHQMPPTYGFVNGIQVERTPERAQVLRDWVAAGHGLGNHSYTHPTMSEVGVEAFTADIDANTSFLAEFEPAAAGPAGAKPSAKYFRYPFLAQGFDADSTRAVRTHLLDTGHTIAEVSIDFGDWAWQPVYERCQRIGSAEAERSIEKLAGAYLQTAWVFLGWAEEAGRRAAGRPIPHVLLLHSTDFTARVLDDLLTAYEKQGVRWVPLDKVLSDEFYATHEPPPKTAGDSILEQKIRNEGADHPPWVQQPLSLLDAICR